MHDHWKEAGILSEEPLCSDNGLITAYIAELCNIIREILFVTLMAFMEVVCETDLRL